ncbi:MAG: hypothetical protein LQ352_008373, partial [Teloschistes flavicans]
MHPAYNLHFLGTIFPILVTLQPAAAVPTLLESRSWLSASISKWSDVFNRPQPVVGCDKPKSNKLHTDTGTFNPKEEKGPANEIPQYVLDYAPLVHLYSGEKFWPCDMAEHLEHVTPYLNYTQIRATSEHLNLTNLDELNQYSSGRFVYLTSDDNVEARPDWLGGEKNIPDTPDEDGTRRESVGNRNNPYQRPFTSPQKEEGHPILGGRSSAPAVLITVDKPNNITDAFWFFFYSYNLGNLVFNIRFGNHIGDWEHTLVRFQHGKPTHVFVSEHYFGQAYTYDAVEKAGGEKSESEGAGKGKGKGRPVVYSAVGTHAMYATPGHHPYVLPLGLLHDETDKGPLWDPALNALTYTYNPATDHLAPCTTRNPNAPTEWFAFRGHWGDRHYPLDDARQYEFAGQYHYVDGPLGP